MSLPETTADDTDTAQGADTGDDAGTAPPNGDGTNDSRGTDDADDSSGDDPTSQLGDAGKRAIDAMKAERNEARRALKPVTTLMRELGIKSVDELRGRLQTPAGDAGSTDGTTEGKPTDGKPAVDADKIRREAQAEARQAADQRVIRAEVKAAAAGKLADPGDALRFLDLTEIELDDDGNVDADEVADAISDLVKKKPYLAAQSGKRFQGTADTGARQAKPTRPLSLGEAVSRRLKPS